MDALSLLVTHLLTTDLAHDLEMLHDLALYESGDALLGENEKNALCNTRQLSIRLASLSEAEKDILRSLLK